MKPDSELGEGLLIWAGVTMMLSAAIMALAILAHGYWPQYWG